VVSDFQSSKRLKNIKPSGIRRFFELTKGMPNIIHLNVGEPDFAPPKHTLDVGWEALREGRTHYAPTNGISELREALAQKFYRDCGLNYDPDSEILVTVGGTEAIFLALMGLVDSGDEALIPDPGFICYEPSVLLAEGIPVSVPLLEENRFRTSADDVTSLITDKSRVMILNHPNNPTGSMLSYEEAAALAEIAVDRDLIVICDDVYEKIVYGGAKHFCLASFPGMRERTLIVNSFSKTYAMTGLRVGYICGPKELMAPIWLAHQYIVACVDTVAQYIALAALKGSQDFIDDMVKEFDRRRKFIHRRLNEIEGFKCLLPEGAFYVFPSVKNFGMPSEVFAEYLAREAHVTTVPGSAFGKHGEGYIRISYAAAFGQLEEALNRIEKAVKRLQ
jgi:aminotransferase